MEARSLSRAAARRRALAVAGAGALLAAGAVPAAGGGDTPGDCRVIESFANARAGQFPPEWQVRQEVGRSVYSVAEEGSLRFLRAVARGVGIQAARAVEWDLDAYPVLAWSWRPVEFPGGADERDGRNDSVLAVYVLVPHSRISGPKAVKYIWSQAVPLGTRLESNGGLTQVRVLRSGTAGAGEWSEARVNARADYRDAFRESRTPRPAGIAVLTDSDDTRSVARGDYASFRICRG